MIEIEKTLVPESTGDGMGNLVYTDSGLLKIYEHGNTVNVYLFHEDSDDGTRALEITMPYPMTREKCINAAEMKVYNLYNAMDVASFSASLSRKSRTGEDAEEVEDHDRFISEVKTELDNLGIM